MRASLRRLLLPCAAAALLAACATPAAAAQPSSGCRKPLGPHRYFVTMPVDGVQRSALVNLPPAAAPGAPLPLLMMFHGAGSTGPGTDLSIGLTDVANRYGFISVYPDGNGPYWDDSTGPTRENADVTFGRELLDQLDSGVCVDDSRVYAAGGSWGGGFATLFGCEMSGRLAAIASVAGIYGIEPRCQLQRPLPLLEIHGTADSTVPYNGSARTRNVSVASFLSHWLQLDSCPPQRPVSRRLGRNVVLQQWSGCAGGSTVAHVRLAGEEHVWPRPARSDRVPFNASLALIEFFSTQTVQADTVPQQRRGRRSRRARR